jgi:hypothetical protein
LKTVFADPTPRWVPFTAAAMIVVGVWVATVWQTYDFAFATTFAVGLACVLFVLIFFQGRYFWRDQVDRITGDGEYFEAVTTRWLGRGKHVAFGPHETSNWVARPKNGKPGELSSIAFRAKKQALEMSFVNPKQFDLEAMATLAPEFFAGVKRDFPMLKSIAG